MGLQVEWSLILCKFNFYHFIQSWKILVKNLLVQLVYSIQYYYSDSYCKCHSKTYILFNLYNKSLLIN
jgi:hypothetical protein